MAGKGKRPWGDALAIVGNGDEAKWIRLGPVWKNEDGSYTANLEAEPVAWSSPRCERRLQFRQRNSQGSRSSRRDDDE